MKDFQEPKPITKKYFWFIVFPLILLFLFVLWLGFAHAQWDGGRGDVVPHTPNPLDWIAKYQGRRMGCCGHNDCVPVRMRILRQWENGGQGVYDVEFTVVNTNETFTILEFPSRAVYVSEDEKDYFCFVPKTFGSDYGSEGKIYNDPCVQNPQLECSNCFFWAPKV